MPKPTEPAFNGPAVVTCFERDSCLWGGNTYPCKGTNGYSLEFQYNSTATKKFTLQKFRFVKSVDSIGNFKTDIDFDYNDFTLNDYLITTTITANLKSAFLEADLP